MFSVSSVVKGLRAPDCDRHGIVLKPTRAILLCSWERHFIALFPAWRSWQAVLNSVKSLKNFNRTAIFWHLRKQVGLIAYPTYWDFHRFPASQEDKYRDCDVIIEKIIIKNNNKEIKKGCDVITFFDSFINFDSKSVNVIFLFVLYIINA